MNDGFRCRSTHPTRLLWSHSRRSTIRTRIMRAFHAAIRVQHHGAGMTDRVGQHHVVAGRRETIDEVAIEPRLDHEVADRLAPGLADIPARPFDGLVEPLAM